MKNKLSEKECAEIVLKSGKTGMELSEYCQENNLDYSYIFNTLFDAAKRRDAKIKAEQAETDDRAEIEYQRDDEGKIQYYAYNIFRKNRTPLCGKLTREEMATIHRLYSYYGDALTQRVISRHFPELSLIDFKRILRAFNITKASAPFPLHYFEEHTEEELRAMQLREKENSFLRKAEEDAIKNNEKLLKKYAQENIDLREQLKKAQFTVDLKNITPYKIDVSNNGNKVINLYLADIHLGAAVVTGAMYDENANYGPTEVIRRLQVIINKLAEIGPFNKINVVLLGDNIDCAGFYGKTARLDHDMPENMDPREQANHFISIMKWFIQSLLDSFNATIEVFSVPNGNHAGNYEYVCNKALMSTINAAFPGIKTTLWEDFYGLFEVNGLRFICTHGNIIFAVYTRNRIDY